LACKHNRRTVYKSQSLKLNTGWKNRPCWIRGGIIAFVFYICSLLAGLLPNISESIFSRKIIFVISFPALFSPWLIVGDDPGLTGTIISPVFLSIYMFIAGSLIDLIYGKIKNRN